MNINLDFDLQIYAKCKRPDSKHILEIGKFYKVIDINLDLCQTSVTIKLHSEQGHLSCFENAAYDMDWYFDFYHNIGGTYKQINVRKSGLINTECHIHFDYKMLEYINEEANEEHLFFGDKEIESIIVSGKDINFELYSRDKNP